MKKRLAVILLLAIFCCGALSLTADASTPTTVTALMDSLKQSVTEAVYNVDLNAPFSKETSGVRESVSTETGGMLVRNTLLSIPGRNGMDLDLSLVYNNHSAKLYDEGTRCASVSNSYGTVIAFYDVFDSNGYWIKTGALQYTSSDSTILGSTAIDGDSWGVYRIPAERDKSAQNRRHRQYDARQIGG